MGESRPDPIPVFVRPDSVNGVDLAVVPGSLIGLLLLFGNHLHVGGKHVPPLGDQPAEIVAIALHGHMNATWLKVLR